MKRFGYLIAALLILILLVAQGCQAQTSSGVSKDDLTMVNNYLKGINSKEMSMNDATDISHTINENSQTNEKKSDWQFLVDYIRNQTNAKLATLDYSIDFSSDSFQINLDKAWERIGG